MWGRSAEKQNRTINWSLEHLKHYCLPRLCVLNTILYPMHNAQCPMHNAQCTCETTKLHGTHLCWWVWLASLLFAAFAPLHVQLCNCASLSLSYHFFHWDWLNGWLQLPVITGQVAKNVMEWIKIPGNLLPAQDYHILISAELALNVFAMHANYLSSAVELACPPI